MSITLSEAQRIMDAAIAKAENLETLDEILKLRKND